MSERLIRELGDLCKEIRLLGDNQLLDMALCAYAAVSGSSQKTNVDVSYTSVMRELRKKKDLDVVRKFQRSFKDAFERALDEDVEDPANVALMVAMKAIKYRKEE
jgi:hypothetical protein